MFSRSSKGRPGNVLETSRINLPGTSLGCQIKTSPRCYFELPQGISLGRPRDGQIGSLGDVLGTLEKGVLGTSWGPKIVGWVIIITRHLFSFYNIFFSIQQAFVFHPLVDFCIVHNHIVAFFPVIVYKDFDIFDIFFTIYNDENLKT